MGKVSKPRKSVGAPKTSRQPLAIQIEDNDLRKYGNLSTKSLHSIPLDNRQKLSTINEDDEENEDVVPSKLTAKILRQAQQQKIEIEGEDDEDMGIQKPDRQPFSFDDVEYDVEEMEDDGAYNDADLSVEMSAEDEAMLNMYMSGAAPVRRTLADMIMEKIKEKEENQAMQIAQVQIPEKVVHVYSQVGVLLSRYRSGKLPKAIKVVPSLKNWEEIMHLTKPTEWTSAALAAITRLFASNFNSRMAQRFYNLVLLPRIRADIESHKKLNFHLYMAMRKAIFKPAAFFKGILLPLAEDACTAREAVIVCSILTRISIPMMHSGAALVKLAQMPYSGPVSMFMKTLLNKKYSLPYQVISAMVKYFDGFISDDRVLPVIWHQTFLVFAQRYKNVIIAEHKEKLKSVMRVHEHHQITPEIRRELFTVSTAQPVLDQRAMSAALNFNQ
uniref:Bystin n=1 Tax=Spongospora subterranea TaxID=70186 RepID=A0A0H5R909_9EUKA|eukprot:CRZ04869.1 hypothetical protein [Spongospora subterranea]